MSGYTRAAIARAFRRPRTGGDRVEQLYRPLKNPRRFTLANRPRRRAYECFTASLSARRRHRDDGLEHLTDRERGELALMGDAGGESDRATAVRNQAHRRKTRQ